MLFAISLFLTLFSIFLSNSGLAQPAYIAKVIIKQNLNINENDLINKFNDIIIKNNLYFNKWNKKIDNVKLILQKLSILLIKMKIDKNKRDDIIGRVRKSYEDY